MRAYETIAILTPDIGEADFSAIEKRVEKALNMKPGKLLKKDDWGVKRLAYPIKKERQGRYLCWSFNHGPEIVKEVDRNLRFDEKVLRFMTVVVDPPTEKEKAAKAAEAAKAPTDYESGRGRGEGRGRSRGGMDLTARIDYKDPITLAKFISDRGKIVPRRNSGANAHSQRVIATAVKRARQIALLSYTEGFFAAPAPQPAESRERGEA